MVVEPGCGDADTDILRMGMGGRKGDDGVGQLVDYGIRGIDGAGRVGKRVGARGGAVVHVHGRIAALKEAPRLIGHRHHAGGGLECCAVSGSAVGGGRWCARIG